MLSQLYSVFQIPLSRQKYKDQYINYYYSHRHNSVNFSSWITTVLRIPLSIIFSSMMLDTVELILYYTISLLFYILLKITLYYITLFMLALLFVHMYCKTPYNKYVNM